MAFLTPNLAAILGLIREFREGTDILDLEGDEELMLAALALDWHAGHQITVGQVMARREFRTPTYAYRRLVALRNRNWVRFIGSPIDQRVKFVQPTEKARRYFADLGRAVDAHNAFRKTP